MQQKNIQNDLSTVKKNRKLSVILCSRNDQYMGNSKWRLQTSLNYVAQNLSELGRVDDVEIIVSDWGSKTPLHKELELNSVAEKIVSFLITPPEIAKKHQKDSPFSEVHALNAAARRTNGQYIGRIDQDTLIGKQFLKSFFEICENPAKIDKPFNASLLFSNRRSIPYRFAVRCPAIEQLSRFINLFGSSLKVWDYNPHWPNLFWTSYVGIWLIHRDLWNECGGYDERLIYYDWMEVDIILRLNQKYPVVNLGKIVNHDFYHLDHYQLRQSWTAVLHPRVSSKTNPDMDIESPPEIFHPNGDDWGLVNYPLELAVYSQNSKEIKTVKTIFKRSNWSTFILLLLTSWLQICWDSVISSLAYISRSLQTFYRVWKQRVKTIRATINGRPIFSWHRLLINLWSEKKYIRLQQKNKS